MPNANLTAQSVPALKSGDRDHLDFWDPSLAGFGCRVYSTGRRMFIVRYRANGKRAQQTLGKYPRLSAKAARAMASDIIEGIQSSDDDLTLKDYWPAFLVTKRDLKNGSKANLISAYETYLLPALGHLPMCEVTRADVAAALPKNRTVTTQDGVRRVASTIWSSAMRAGWGGVEVNPAIGVTVGKLARRARKFSLSEAKTLWDEIMAMPALQSAALRVIVLTGQRMNQVLSMRWDEIEGPTWKCPARELNKSGRELWIPLSDQVVEILDALRAMDLDREFVFPAMRTDSGTGHMSSMSKVFATLASKAGVKDARCHDWRRTFTSFAIKPVTPADVAATAGLGITLGVAASCLSHAPEKQELAWGHYMDAEDRAMYLMPERREAMQAWADFLLGAVA